MSDAIVYATDDPRVFELRLPESVAPPEGVPQVRLANYLCAESGNCESGCPVCNRKSEGRWSTSIDYLLFDADNAYSFTSPGESTDAIAQGVRLQVGEEAEDGFGWRLRYEWFGHSSDAYETAFRQDLTNKLSAQRLGLDFYQRFAVGRTQFRLGMGAAAAMAQHTNSFSRASYLQKYNGVGLGTFVDFSTAMGRVGQTDFAVVGGFGHDYLSAGDGGIWIRQLNLGVEARREFDHGSLILQTTYEHQSWSGLPELHGASFRLGYTW